MNSQAEMNIGPDNPESWIQRWIHRGSIDGFILGLSMNQSWMLAWYRLGSIVPVTLPVT